MSFRISALYLLLLLPSLSIAANTSDEQKFLSAPSFAMVGTSYNESKVGTMVLNELLAKGMSAVSINPFVAESQGIATLDSLSDLPNPAQTSISIVTQPAVCTLQILKQVHELGVFAVWLQPGAQDAAVLKYLANSSVMALGTYIYSSVQGEMPTPPTCAFNPDFPDLIATLSA
ncbi:CoA binding domain-containing protein [Mycena vulgaris]|nr:CoA binding domain-containing protein [Mycena vulgaris]